MMTDPIADMLTRIRNANAIERPYVEIPATKMKVAIARVLLEEGYILGYRVGKYVTVTSENSVQEEFHEVDNFQEPHLILQVFLKYGPDGEKVIRHIERVSKPGRRIYKSYKELRPVLNGQGIAVLSTSRGILSDRQARRNRIGGEVLCAVW